MLKLKHFGWRLLMLKYFDLLIQMLSDLHLPMLKRFDLLILTQTGSRLLR